MASLLIVDDEIKILNVLREYAEFNGFSCEFAENGKQAVEKVISRNYDCIIMDIMMPIMDGLTAVKEIKKIKNIPIIIMSAKGEEYDVLHGFEIGADDYVIKPFSPKEIMARVKAILKRNGVNERMTFGKLEIDDAGHNVYINNEPLKLTNKEYELLLLLVRNKEIVLSRDKILNAIWNDFDVDDRIVDAHIKMLRNDLKECAKFIVTVRGVGYKFEEN